MGFEGKRFSEMLLRRGQESGAQSPHERPGTNRLFGSGRRPFSRYRENTMSPTTHEQPGRRGRAAPRPVERAGPQSKENRSENGGVKVKISTIERFPIEIEDTLTESSRRAWAMVRAELDTGSKLPEDVTLPWVVAERTFAGGKEKWAWYSPGDKTGHLGLAKIRGVLGLQKIDASTSVRKLVAQAGAHETVHRGQQEMGQELVTTPMNDAQHASEPQEKEANRIAYAVVAAMFPDNP